MDYLKPCWLESTLFKGIVWWLQNRPSRPRKGLIRPEALVMAISLFNLDERIIRSDNIWRFQFNDGSKGWNWKHYNVQCGGTGYVRGRWVAVEINGSLVSDYFTDTEQDLLTYAFNSALTRFKVQRQHDRNVNIMLKDKIDAMGLSSEEDV